jgi:hypothetical protein
VARDYQKLYDSITKRYGSIAPEALESVLCPVLIPIRTIDRSIFRPASQSNYRASFTVGVSPRNQHLMQRGRTGKFVPSHYVDGSAPWREIAKGRITDVDVADGIASGEVYIGSSSTKADLALALDQLHDGDYLEIDQYGASAKVLSALVEYYLCQIAADQGYRVTRMPEDIARHLGVYYCYDFKFERDGIAKKVEVKSIWGTNTRCARLIHSKGGDYPTSSCKFDTQDFFAVSLFLRTGNIRDFAFARSVPRDVKPYGLPRAKGYPGHVNQNPLCEIGDGTWFSSIDEVWSLD